MSKYQEANILNAQNLSISCNDVPDALLNKTAAKHYFQQYGKVLRIRLRPKHKMVIVEFANEESAQTAYAESGTYEGQDFIVSWTKTNDNKRKVRKKVEDPNWSDDPDIKNELEAMKGSFNTSKSYHLRPEGMMVDAPKKMQPQKSKARLWKSKNPESNMTDQENDLLKTIETCATTNEEKFRILDARDKLIRSRTVRQSELARAVRTIGTCPDMCPEKERLMREVQHQVASYEQQAGISQKNQMNHKLAVKQYSRSSADQESPLAHELRPVEVLHLTMGYLLHRILDLCSNGEVNLAEWYHFVWDRTRGIRKDITQQELCCPLSVHLVEQCARFHVHCAARLVAEDLSVFDDKINTENLTKCLQTLKYMYHDLNVKNIKCKNEAEFRAYIVLLNLNDGNFMWEVQQLSPEIQRSHEIRFALQVYSALDKNNFVRFFKLIKSKSTSYLNACILLRYFNQVRYRALLTILKSYSPRLPYPVEDLCQMLAFEDVASTIAFLEYHELQLNPEKTHVLLERNRFRQPDTPFALDRAINIVESKRHTSVGQIVCGEQLPPKLYETHVPHDSFDLNGYLKISELPKDFHNRYQQFLKQFIHLDEQQDIEEEPKNKTFTTETNETKDSGGFVFKLPSETIEPVDEEIVPISDVSEIDGEIQSFFGSVNLLTNESRSQSPITLKDDQFIEETKNTTSFWGKTSTITSNIFGNTSVFKPIEISERMKSPSPELLLQAASPELDDLIEQQLIEQQKVLQEKLLEEEKKERERRERRQRLADEKKQIKQNALLIYEKEFGKVLTKIVEQLLDEVKQDEIKIRLEEISNNIKMRKVLQYGRRWRNLTRISKKKRKNFFDNPVWVSTRSVQQQADQLFTSSQTLTIQDIKRYKCGTSTCIPIQNKLTLAKIDVFQVVWKIFFKQFTESDCDVFWKIGLSLPQTDNDTLLRLLDDTLQLKNNLFVKTFKCNNGGSLNVCFKRIVQFVPEHFNGIIFFGYDQQTFHKIINNNNNKYPVVVLLKTTESTDKIEQQLSSINSVSVYKILKYSEKNLSEILCKCLMFLAENENHHQVINKLETNEFAALLRNCLGDEFWSRIKSSIKLNVRFSILLKAPNNVIDLYNEALKFVTKILFEPGNYHHPSFPTEFKHLSQKNVVLPCSYQYFPDYWNVPAYLNKLKQLLKSFSLPKLNDEWPPENHQHFQQIIEDYCHKIFQSNNKQIVYKILSTVYRNVPHFHHHHHHLISWIDIIELIVMEKIGLTQFNDDTYPIYTLIYDIDEMRNYRMIPWWFQLKTIQQGIRSIHYVEEFPEPEIDVSFEDVNVTEICDQINLDQDETDKQNIHQFNVLNNLLNDLEQSMEIQKKIMKKFEERALMALE